MADAATLSVLLRLRDEASRGVQSFTQNLQASAKEARAMGLQLSAMGAAMSASIGLLVKAALDEQVSINALAQAMQRVGVSYQATKGDLEAYFAAQQRVTNFGDDQQRAALMRLITITGDYGSSLKALPVVLDAAAALNMDLAAAANIVGRALVGNTELLARYGIEIEKGTTGLEAMAAIHDKVRGAAQAAANPLTQLKNDLSDTAEVLGNVLVPIITPFIQTLRDALMVIQKWTDAHPLLTKVIGISAVAVAGLTSAAGGALLMFGLMTPVILTMSKAFVTASTAAGGFLARLALLVAPLTAAAAAGLTLGAATEALMQSMAGRGTFLDLFRERLELIKQDAQNLLKPLTDMASSLGEGLGPTLEEAERLAQKFADTMESKLKTVLPEVTAGIQGLTAAEERLLGAFQRASPLLAEALESLGVIGQEALAAFRAELYGVAEAAQTVTRGVVQGFNALASMLLEADSAMADFIESGFGSDTQGKIAATQAAIASMAKAVESVSAGDALKALGINLTEMAQAAANLGGALGEKILAALQPLKDTATATFNAMRTALGLTVEEASRLWDALKRITEATSAQDYAARSLTAVWQSQMAVAQQTNDVLNQRIQLTYQAQLAEYNRAQGIIYAGEKRPEYLMQQMWAQGATPQALTERFGELAFGYLANVVFKDKGGERMRGYIGPPIQLRPEQLDLANILPPMIAQPHELLAPPSSPLFPGPGQIFTAGALPPPFVLGIPEPPPVVWEPPPMLSLGIPAPPPIVWEPSPGLPLLPTPAQQHGIPQAATVIININAPVTGVDHLKEVITSTVRDTALGGGFHGILQRA